MDPFLFPEEHQPPYSDANTEMTWPPDSSLSTYALNPHQYASTRDSPQFTHDSIGQPPDYCTTSYSIESSQGSLHPFDYSYEHLMQSVGIVAVYLKPYNSEAGGPFPSPEQQHQNNSYSPPPLPVAMPELPYQCGNPQKDWIKMPPIFFSKEGIPGVKLVDVLKGRFRGIDDRDGFPFGEDCSGITIRIHFLGYPSSTQVEKELSKLAEIGERPKARSMQVSTKDYRKPRRPVIRSKLLREISKRVNWHISDLLENADLFLFDEKVGEEWRLEEGTKFEYMTITSLDNVSAGSWSPVIWVDRPSSYPGISSTFS